MKAMRTRMGGLQLGTTAEGPPEDFLCPILKAVMAAPPPPPPPIHPLAVTLVRESRGIARVSYQSHPRHPASASSQDPVMATDGHSYEREAIEQWLSACRSGRRTRATRCLCTTAYHRTYHARRGDDRPFTSPKTNARLPSDELRANHTLKVSRRPEKKREKESGHHLLLCSPPPTSRNGEERCHLTAHPLLVDSASSTSGASTGPRPRNWPRPRPSRPRRPPQLRRGYPGSQNRTRQNWLRPSGRCRAA
jgi:hypothetical protein